MQLYVPKRLDGSDIRRIIQFTPDNMLFRFGLDTKDVSQGNREVLEFTRENILNNLEKDVSFGFKVALEQDGFNSSLMYSVVKMWNWILEEGLEDFDSFTHYGLPLFRETALEYGFNNPIGDDYGDERRYSGW